MIITSSFRGCGSKFDPTKAPNGIAPVGGADIAPCHVGDPVSLLDLGPWAQSCTYKLLKILTCDRRF